MLLKILLNNLYIGKNQNIEPYVRARNQFMNNFHIFNKIQSANLFTKNKYLPSTTDGREAHCLKDNLNFKTGEILFTQIELPQIFSTKY